MSANTPRHFLELKDIAASDLRDILSRAQAMKAARPGLPAGAADPEPAAPGRMLALIFEEVSTRTRISFDVGMRQMGGETMYLTGRELQLGRGESIADTARVLGRYVDAIAIRVLSHDMLADLARHSPVPVINGLTRRSHPCQVMADIMTFEERKGPIDNATVAWSGDARNNVASSWIEAAAAFGFALRLAAPAGHEPRPDLVAWARSQGAQIWSGDDPWEAVQGADCVITDAWASLGDEDLEERRERMVPYQVNDALMARAAPDAIFLHCLPAHRGEEVSGSVIDGARSAVWDEAENRLHAQKGILAWCLE